MEFIQIGNTWLNSKLFFDSDIFISFNLRGENNKIILSLCYYDNNKEKTHQEIIIYTPVQLVHFIQQLEDSQYSDDKYIFFNETFKAYNDVSALDMFHDQNMLKKTAQKIWDNIMQNSNNVNNEY